MAEISLINIGGTNYDIKDKVAREQSSMYGKDIGYDEPGTTASQPYPKVGTIIFWHSALEPMWVYTKTAIAKGERFQLGVNIEQKPTLGTMISDIKTYVDGDGKLHFVDSRGADTELNFSAVKSITVQCSYTRSNNGADHTNVANYFESPTSKISIESKTSPLNGILKYGYRVKENMTVKVQAGYYHDSQYDWYPTYNLVDIWNDRTGKHIIISRPNTNGVKKYASGQLECLSGDIIYAQWQAGPFQYGGTQYECIFYG